MGYTNEKLRQIYDKNKIQILFIGIDDIPNEKYDENFTVEKDKPFPFHDFEIVFINSSIRLDKKEVLELINSGGIMVVFLDNNSKLSGEDLLVNISKVKIAGSRIFPEKTWLNNIFTDYKFTWNCFIDRIEYPVIVQNIAQTIENSGLFEGQIIKKFFDVTARSTNGRCISAIISHDNGKLILLPIPENMSANLIRDILDGVKDNYIRKNDINNTDIATFETKVLGKEAVKKEYENMNDEKIDIMKPNPKIVTIHISNTRKNIIRVAVVQFCFELTKLFPPTVMDRNDVKKKIFLALDLAKKNGTNIVCLPELCLCEEWILEIKKNYEDMIIIGGGFYKDNKNVCPIIIKSDKDIPWQCKIMPSAPEDAEKWKNGMVPGDEIRKYETQFGKFVVLICRDFEEFAHYFRKNDIDFIFCPAYNDSNKRFHDEANNHVTKTPSYILMANTGKYGGTSIFGQLNKNYFSRLIGEGCKKEIDLDYKLCEVREKKEEIIIADFDLNNKSVHVPTPSDSSKEKIGVTKIRKLSFLTYDKIIENSGNVLKIRECITADMPPFERLIDKNNDSNKTYSDNIVIESEWPDIKDSDRLKDTYHYIFRGELNEDTIIDEKTKIYIEKYNGPNDWSPLDGDVINFLYSDHNMDEPKIINISKIGIGIYLINKLYKIDRLSMIIITSNKIVERLRITIEGYSYGRPVDIHIKKIKDKPGVNIIKKINRGKFKIGNKEYNIGDEISDKDINYIMLLEIPGLGFTYNYL